MLSSLIIRLKPENDLPFSINYGSLFHGIIMENIDENYANILHDSGLKPYTQHIERDKDAFVWIINALNKEANEKILNIFYNHKIKKFYLRDKDKKLIVENMERIEITYDSLVETTYFSENSRMFQINFTTPTAFKSDGEYIFYPDIRLIYQSLMNKFNTFSEENSMDSEETLEHLKSYTKIYKYNLRSTFFYLEGVKIPSFTGYIQIKINGPKELVNLSHLLFKFGEFSGIGIKTAIGMGNIKYSNKILK
ncbi:MAG: CRISPR system precrRNA processing endoribonuclease RAMP protein Cas6 [Fusobacteriaceae bacterium]|jgi:CRISPR-associated endoribonuclease Cas6|nr:CRISPR system precrRNA processing endoribonuclease RAMP protein Cas6 [Fusobacteriaceae bacterium]